MTVKERLHQLVDALPESEAHAAERMLEFLREAATESPLIRALRNAPLDDEPVTPEEEAAVAEAYEAIRRGEVLTDEELRHELGI